MGKVGDSFIQGVRSLFGKPTALQVPNNLDLIHFNSATGEWELVSGVVGTGVQTSSNVGTGEGVAKPRVGNDLPFRSLVAGTGIVLTGSTNEIEIKATSATPPPSFIQNSLNTQTIASGTQYLAIVGIDTENSTEANRQTVFPNSCKLKRLTLYISAQRNGISTFRIRKNGANGNQVINVPANTTGLFQDLSNEDSIGNGDLVAIEVVRGGTGGNLIVDTTALEVVAP